MEILNPIYLRRISDFVFLWSLGTIPYFVHLQSANPFEGSKAVCLRVFALVLLGIEILVAMGTRRTPRDLVAGVRRRFEGSRAGWIVLTATLFLLSTALSTVTSIDPSLSFWGSYGRRQGLYTSLAYLVMFAYLALRADPAFVRRGMAVLLQTGVAVCLYGFVQAAGHDRLGWAIDVVSRPTSTFGNSGLFAAFVAALVPLASWNLFKHPATGRDPVAFARRAGAVIASHVVLLASLHLSARFEGLASPVLLLVTLALVTSVWSSFALPVVDDDDGALSVRRRLPRRRLGGSLPLACFLVILLLTQSRGAQVAVAVTGALAWVFVSRRRASPFGQKEQSWRRYRMGANVCLAVAALLVVIWNLSHHRFADELRGIRYIGRMGKWLSLHDESSRARILLWFGDEHGRGAVGLVTARLRTFLVGAGPETFDRVYGPFFPPSLTRGSLHDAFPDRAHQAELDVWATQGILGLLSFLSLYGALFWTARRERSSAPVLACTAAITVLFVDDALEIPSIASTLTFWTLLGWVVALLAVKDRAGDPVAPSRAPSPSPPWGRALLALALVGAGAWFGNLSEMRADSELVRGRLVGAGDERSLIAECEHRDAALSSAFRKSHYASELASTLVFMSARADDANATHANTDSSKGPPSTCRALFARGRVELLQSARSLLRFAREKDATNKDILAHAAQVDALLYHATGEPPWLEEATRGYERAIAAAPNDVRLLNEHASLLARAGRTTEALAELERSAILDPEYEDTRLRRAYVHELEQPSRTEAQTR